MQSGLSTIERIWHFTRVTLGAIVFFLIFGGILMSLLGVINPGSPYLMFE